MSCESVEQFFKTLRNNCFTGYDHIPTSFIKPVADLLIYSVSPILNNFIEVNQFTNVWKSIDLVQFLK